MSGRIAKKEAHKKSITLSYRVIAVRSISGPGINSARVGPRVLKMVVGFAINPWGIKSRRKCESNEAPATVANLCGSFEAVWMVSVVIKHDTAMCVVAVISFAGERVNLGKMGNRWQTGGQCYRKEYYITERKLSMVKERAVR